jgi:hypothetical protein
MSLELEQPDTAPDSAAVDTAPPEAREFSFDSPEDSTETELTPEQQAVEDEIEEELEGIKLRGPKDALEKLKAERLMQADYTRKTQEVAEHRKALEAREQHFQRTAQGHQQHIREVAQLVAIEDRLQQFSQVNWQAITDADPVQALKLHTELTQLQARKGQLEGALTQRQQAAQYEQQRNTAKHLMEARQVLEREIKGWSPELAGKLKEYGLTQGFPEEAMDSITQPAIVKVLHKAHLYDQLQKQRTAKPAAQPAPPVTRVGGGAASSTKPLSEVSDAEYIRRRREYISKHR